ncbi:MAG: DUF2240 family protein [Candidatus Thermoplasmatota archaeon]|jgi:hypothetical protein|nr:DUF2240 family protein [Candidatus Thermoplasmatota archaeon]MCL5793611.1 DUF2240 family protein [Candidatus Thermoplasmatota archaeon]
MDLETARRIIARCFNARKDREVMTRADIVREVSYKNRLLAENSVDRFLKACLENNLLKDESGSYKPTFSTSGVIIPLDFSVDEDSLFLERKDASLADRIMEKVIASGKISRKVLGERVEEMQKHLQYVPYEFVLATLAVEEQVDISEFIEELGRNGKKIQA